MSHSEHRKPLLISFSGIDGAGKSTQIALLAEALELDGVRVRHITFWDDVAQLKSLREGVGHKVFRGDKGVGSPEAPISRKDKNVQSPLVTLFRLGLYLLDALSLRRVVRQAFRSDANPLPNVIIFDRYIYDELANVSLSNGIMRLYIKLVAGLTPSPDAAFVVDADPVAAFARKPEYPLEFLHKNRDAYLGLGEILGTMTVIPPMEIDAAHARIIECVRRQKNALLPVGEVAGHFVS